MGAEVVNLNGQSVTKKEPETKTTQHGDKVTQKVEQTTYNYTPELAEEDKRQQEALAAGFGVNPKTGKVDVPDNKSLSQLFGFDPAVYEKEQQEKQRIADFKRKEAGWKNAMGVIVDAITAGHGGNVGLRQPDNKAAEARDEAEKANENIRNMGSSVQQAIRGIEKSYADAELKRKQAFLKNLVTKNSTTYTRQGDDVTTTTGGNSTTERTYQQALKGDGNGKGTKKIAVQINSDPNNVHTNEFEVSQADYDVTLGIIMQRYADVIEKGNTKSATQQQATDAENMKNFLQSIGVTYNYDSKAFTGNKDQILQNGRYFGLDDNTIRKIEEKTGGKVKFADMKEYYWSPISGQENKRPVGGAAN